MIPCHQGNAILFHSSKQLTCNFLGPLKDFKAPHLPHALLPELQRNKETVICAELGTKVSGHRQLTQTLIVRLSKMHSFTRTPIIDCE